MILVNKERISCKQDFNSNVSMGSRPPDLLGGFAITFCISSSKDGVNSMRQLSVHRQFVSVKIERIKIRSGL